MAEQSQALQKFTTLVRLNPDDPEAHFGLAMAYEDIRNFAKAFKEYETVVRINPRHARAHLHMGFAFARGNEQGPAIKEWQLAFQLDPKIDKYFDDPANRGYYSDRIRESIETFERPTKHRPDDSWGHYQLAMTYRFFGKKELALSHLNRAIDLNSNLWEAFNAAGQIYAELGQVQSAKINFQKAIDVNPKYSESYYNLGTLLEEEGMVGLAIQRYERALEGNPENAKLLFALGRAYLKQGQYKKAIGRLQKSLDKDPRDPNSHFLLGKSCEAIYRPDFAIKEYEKTISIDPQYIEAHYNLGLIHLQLGAPDKAIKSLEQALKLNPTDSYAHYNLGNAYNKVGNLEKAINHYYNAVSINPKDTYARYNLAQSYLKTKRYDDAIKEFNKALELTPQDFSIYFSLGKAYVEKGDFYNAIEIYTKLVSLKPYDPDVHYALGQAFMSDKKYDVAEAEFKRVLELRPEDPETYYDRGQCFLNIGEVDSAFEQFQQAIKYDVSHARAKYGIGIVYSKYRKKPDIALDFFNQAIEVDDKFIPAYIEKGYSLLKLNKLNDAQLQFEKAGHIDSQNPDIITGTAEVYVAKGHYDSAEKEFQRAIAMDPENANTRSRYACLLSLEGKLNPAIVQFQQALVMGPEEVNNYFKLANVYLKVGKIAEVKDTLSRLIQVEPQNFRAKKALDILFEKEDQELIGKSIEELLGEEIIPLSVVSPVSEKPQKLTAKKPLALKKKSLKGKIQKKSLKKELEMEESPDTSESIESPIISPQSLTLFTKAVTAQARGKNEEAMDMFMGVLRKSPDYYQVYENLTAITEQLGLHEKSIENLETAIKLSEKFKDKEYVEIFKEKLEKINLPPKEKTEQEDGSIESFFDNSVSGIEPIKKESEEAGNLVSALKVQEEAPIEDKKKDLLDSINERMEIAGNFIDLQRFDRAKSNLYHIIKEKPEYFEAYFLLARISQEEENWDDFLKYWKDYLKFSKNRNKENLFKLIEAYEKIEKFDKIPKILNEIIRNNPDDIDSLEKIIAFYLQQENYSDAIPYLKNLTKKKSDDPRYIFHLARAYRQMEDYSQASIEYQKVLELTKAPEIFNELGYTYEKMNKIDLAIKAYKDNLEMAPSDITANLSLILLYEKNGDLENAIKTIKHTLTIDELTESRVGILTKKLHDLEQLFNETLAQIAVEKAEEEVLEKIPELKAVEEAPPETRLLSEIEVKSAEITEEAIDEELKDAVAVLDMEIQKEIPEVVIEEKLSKAPVTDTLGEVMKAPGTDELEEVKKAPGTDELEEVTKSVAPLAKKRRTTTHRRRSIKRRRRK